MKLIIFDIDGTLCHSKYVDDRCFIRAFEIVLGPTIKNRTGIVMAMQPNFTLQNKLSVI